MTEPPRGPWYCVFLSLLFNYTMGKAGENILKADQLASQEYTVFIWENNLTVTQCVKAKAPLGSPQPPYDTWEWASTDN